MGGDTNSAMNSERPSASVQASASVRTSAPVRPSASVRARKRLRFLRTRLRELRMIGKALVSTKHPILVHIIPNRRCNLACTYCNEFDDFSKPVDTAEMIRRIDRLGEIGVMSDSAAAASRSCIQRSTRLSGTSGATA